MQNAPRQYFRPLLSYHLSYLGTVLNRFTVVLSEGDLDALFTCVCMRVCMRAFVFLPHGVLLWSVVCECGITCHTHS